MQKPLVSKVQAIFNTKAPIGEEVEVEEEDEEEAEIIKEVKEEVITSMEKVAHIAKDIGMMMNMNILDGKITNIQIEEEVEADQEVEEEEDTMEIIKIDPIKVTRILKKMTRTMMDSIKWREEVSEEEETEEDIEEEEIEVEENTEEEEIEVVDIIRKKKSFETSKSVFIMRMIDLSVNRIFRNLYLFQIKKWNRNKVL